MTSAVLTLLSFDRFCDQRWKLTQLSYATAVILHETKLAAEAKQTASPTAAAGAL